MSRVLHRALQPAEPAVVGRQHQVPVAVEHLVQRLEVLRRRERRLLGVRPLVDVPVVLESLLDRGGLHELPRTLRVRLGKRVGLEAALDDRDVREIQRQALGLEDALNHRQVLRPAGEALLDVLAQPALEQLDVRVDARVLRDRDVVLGGFQVRLHDRRRLGIRGRLREGGDLEQLVDRCRLVLLLGEAIALGQRCHLLCVDSVHQTVEMRAEAGVGPRAVRRLEQDVQRAVELASGAIEMPDLELALAGVEMLLRRADERGDRINGRGHGRDRRDRRPGEQAAPWASAASDCWIRSRHSTRVR